MYVYTHIEVSTPFWVEYVCESEIVTRKLDQRHIVLYGHYV